METRERPNERHESIQSSKTKDMRSAEPRRANYRGKERRGEQGAYDVRRGEARRPSQSPPKGAAQHPSEQHCQVQRLRRTELNLKSTHVFITFLFVLGTNGACDQKLKSSYLIFIRACNCRMVAAIFNLGIIYSPLFFYFFIYVIQHTLAIKL